MRESINGAWLLGIVMVFMAVFIAYISISINYSNAYQMRTRMITVIEQYQGVTALTIDKLESIRDYYGYLNKGVCVPGEDGRVISVLNGEVSRQPRGQYNYCITREIRYGDGGIAEDKYYYELTVFFGFGLPIIGNIFNFRVSGETNAIYYPDPYDYFEL